MKIESLLIHGGVDGDDKTGAVNVPIYQTSTYKQPSFGVNKGYEYSRTGNPTREAVEKLIADLEGAKYGLAFGSGMAASTAILSLFKSGDKLIIPDNLYGGTFRVIDKVFNNFDIEYEAVDISKPENVEEILKKENGRVKGVFIETPTNPLMDIADISAIADIAKKYEAISIVDNTFMTPYLQKPLELGADIVVQSATKYLAGHSDVVAGLIALNNKNIADRLYFIQNSTGGVLGPFDSFMLIKGIKTLAVRMDRHNSNAKKIVDYLLNNEYVEKVYYPGLKENPGYEVQKKQARGFGGVVSFVVNNKVDYKKFFSQLKLISFAESLGGVESLICHPATMTHAAIPQDIRQKVGIVDELIRFSVGIENADDLIEDLDTALKNSLK